MKITFRFLARVVSVVHVIFFTDNFVIIFYKMKLVFIIIIKLHCLLKYHLNSSNNVRMVVSSRWYRPDIIDKNRLLLKHQLSLRWRYQRETLLLSRAADGAMSPIWALFLSNWQNKNNNDSFTAARSVKPLWHNLLNDFFLMVKKLRIRKGAIYFPILIHT